jgi:uncharacterized protein YcaQ
VSDTQNLSANEARRIALAAQGMASGVTPNTTATWPRISKAIDRLHLIQIDSVNVVARSHYLPVLARTGPYNAKTLDDRAFGRRRRELFEYWAHEASLLPMQHYPLMRWRMQRARNGIGIYRDLVRFASERATYLDQVRQEVRARGPLRAGDLPDAGSSGKDWWSWSDGKTALEYLFATGEVTTAERQGNFERIYDIPERVIDPDALNAPAPREPDAIRHLLNLSARALGIATERDLRDYFRLPVAETKTAIAQLLDAGNIETVSVDGWQQPAYLARNAELPARATRSALLSPFDPLVWNRERAARVFGFNYRIEIYTPAAKRVYGYYVLPFLMKGRMAGRVCLKSDRQAGTLRVNASHVEPGHHPEDTAIELARQLERLADWLGLRHIHAAPQGNLSTHLAHTL